MTEQTHQIPDIYALLIGIDYYANLVDKNLKGCVRDINLVMGYLQNTLKILPERILKLTAPNPNQSGFHETKDCLPTYENIVAAFHRITEEAPEKAQVYIHYSGHGHGVTLPTIYPEIKGEDQPDEAIVPMDIGDSQSRYLRDVELATLIKRMTDKGLIVTVILDCCHSGGATRGEDSDIRGLDETFECAAQNRDSLVASREELIQNWNTLTTGAVNTSSNLDKWLPESRDYVLLAACRPSEYAREYAVNGKQRHGALTYWMIDTLTSSFSGLTYKALHDRVSAKIQSKFPQQQTPMLLGEGNHFVFGSGCIQLQYALNVLEVDNDSVPKVRLNAGIASGVAVGARFAIYALGITDFTEKEKLLAIVEVKSVGASDAWADVIEFVKQTEIEQGAQAVMQSAPIDLVRGVRLFKKQVGEKQNELPQELVNKQDEALRAVEEAIVGNGWLKLVSDEQQKADYQVAINRKGEYEICVGMPIENLRPALKIGDCDAALTLIKRLVHFTKYQAVGEIDNQFSQLTNQLEVELLTQKNWQPGMNLAPKPFRDPQNPTLTSGEYAFLRIKNTSSQILNIVVLNLEPTWAISLIPLLRIQQTFEEFQPGRELVVPLKPQLPNISGYENAKEIVKVFATVGAADFRWLELPSLDREITSKSGVANRIDNPLGKLLAAIGTDVDYKPPTRKLLPVLDPNQEWATKQLTINITRN